MSDYERVVNGNGDKILLLNINTYIRYVHISRQQLSLRYFKLDQ